MATQPPAVRDAEMRDLEQQRQIGASLHQILTILNSNRPLDEILGYIIAQACRLLDTDAGAIYRLDSAAGRLQVQVACGLDAADAALDLPVDWSATGQAAQAGQPVMIANAAM